MLSVNRAKSGFFLLFLFLFVTTPDLFSQEQVIETVLDTTANNVVAPFSGVVRRDSVNVLRKNRLPDNRCCGTLDSLFVDKKQVENLLKQVARPAVEPMVNYVDTFILDNPYLPVIFRGDRIDINSFIPPSPVAERFSYEKELFKNNLFSDVYHKNVLYENAYRNIIDNHKNLIKYTPDDFKGEVEKITEIEANIFQSLFKVDYDIVKESVEKPGRFTQKRKYWFLNGGNLLQFSQNYISKNWYKGGTGNFNLQSVQNFTANYKKDKIQFNNFFEWKLSLYTASTDTLRSIRIGDDLVRLYSDFGVKAIKNWSYSSNIEIKTQLFRNYKENTTNVVSSALSPIMIKMGVLGMKFQKVKTFPKVKGKKIDFSADISPLSVQYTYVSSSKVDQKRFGIPEDKHSLLDLGSTMTANLAVNFNKFVTFKSRFNYFTNYEKVVIESENELNMPINRYFSTRIYVYARFDDNKSLAKDPALGKLQLNEVLSFGFNYKW
jgi:hypothetical protein